MTKVIFIKDKWFGFWETRPFAWKHIYMPVKLRFNYQYWPIRYHEQCHIDRQNALGRWRWLWRYVTDRSFRFAEEKLGYALEIEDYLHHGRRIKRNRYVKSLSEHYWGMCTEAQARAFVEDVIKQFYLNKGK